MLRLLIFLALWSSCILAETVQDLWTAPIEPDLSVTVVLGEAYTIIWDVELQSIFAQFAPDAQPGNVTLWVAASEQPFAHVISSYVNVSATTQYTWTVNIPANETAVAAYWNFRFAPPSYLAQDIIGTPNNQVDSPQLIIKSSLTAALPSSSVATASATTSSTPSSSTSPSQSASASAVPHSGSTTGASAMESTSTSTSSGPSKGIIAGIVVISIVGAVLIGLLCFLLFRLRQTDAALQLERKFNLDASSMHRISPIPYRSPSNAGSACPNLYSPSGSYTANAYYAPPQPPPPSQGMCPPHAVHISSSPHELPNNRMY